MPIKNPPKREIRMPLSYSVYPPVKVARMEHESEKRTLMNELMAQAAPDIQYKELYSGTIGVNSINTQQ